MRFTAACLLVSALVAHTRAADTAPATWTIDDFITAEANRDFQFSPDGRSLVWVKQAADKEKGEMVGHLIRANLDDRRETTLTRGVEPCVHPRWAPDGRTIAFLSARPGAKSKSGRKAKPGADEDKAQIWLIDPQGGEPWPVTELSRSVQGFGWARSDQILFVAQEEPTLQESTREDRKDGSIVVEDEQTEPPARLFRLDVATKKVTRVTNNMDRIEALAVSPEGRYVFASHSNSLRFPFDGRVKPLHYLYDLESGTRRQVFEDPRWNLKDPRWLPDGSGFLVVHEHSSRPQIAIGGINELVYYHLATGTEEKIDLGWPAGLALQAENEDSTGYAVTANGFLALLSQGVRNKVARYTRAEGSWRREFITGDAAERCFGFAAAPDGSALVYAKSGADSPTRWLTANLAGAAVTKPEILIRPSDTLLKRARARVEVVRWKGALDEEVEGLLFHPPGLKPGVKAPLVVMIHGGPAALDQDCWDESWSYAANLLCQRGAYVLKPNYHGSTGYGQNWLESIAHGKYLDLEPIDIERGVDHLIARGLVDPNKLGLYGWSNGAILANEITTRTTRYKAAVSGAGTIEYLSDWALCDFGDAFDRFYLGKSPLEDPQLYWRKSPFFRLDRVRTPTLIFFGTDDRVVPAHQGWVHFRALQQLGKTDLRFVTFPGEKHHLKKLAHRRRKLDEELAWFDRHLFGSSKNEDPALKTDSLLAWAMKRKNALRHGNNFGILEKGMLVPETVAHGKLRLGRFEITRAQFTAFDPKSPIEVGKENFPAHRLTFAQARDYVAWLSRMTGQRYRLPTEEEADELYDAGEAGDNTLDAWAGYAPNPEDAARLRGAAANLGSGSLLREVGSGRGTGTGELVFDLGGNVAEWVTTKNGQGAVRGGSADRPADGKRQANLAGPEYRGVRVILEGQ